MKILIDTSAFLCLVDTADLRHQTAVSLYKQTREKQAVFFTTSAVLTETITRARYKLGLDCAQKIAELIFREEKRAFLTIVWIDKSMIIKAMKAMEKFKRWELSLTDCLNYVLVKKKIADCLFAFDEDFVKMGLPILK